MAGYDIDDYQKGKSSGSKPSVDNFTKPQKPTVSKPQKPSAQGNGGGGGFDFGAWLGGIGNGIGSFFSGLGDKELLPGQSNQSVEDYTNHSAQGSQMGSGMWTNPLLSKFTGVQNNDRVDGQKVPITGVTGAPQWPPYPNVPFGSGSGPEENPALGYGDFISQAQALLEQFGLGSNGVNYDPYRESSRSQFADADARTAAMYKQLQDSITGDAKGISQNYGGAIKASDERTDDAQAGIQGAYNEANSEAMRQAQALGIEEAVANAITNGTDGRLDKADAVADTEQRGQIAATQYGTNQQSALDANRTTAQAAGLAGANTRAQRQNELNQILSQIDVAEQGANQQARGNQTSQLLGLAGQLFGNSTETQQYRDAQAAKAIELAQNAPQPQAPRMGLEDAMAYANSILGFNETEKRDTPDEQEAFRQLLAVIEQYR